MTGMRLDLILDCGSEVQISTAYLIFWQIITTFFHSSRTEYQIKIIF